MKKYLFGVFMLIAFLGQDVHAMSLYSYMQSKGVWTSCANRKLYAAQHGVFHYDCSTKKNVELMDHLKTDEGMLGLSVVTGYQKTLRTSMTAVQSNVPVSSLALKDGTTITTNTISPKVFLDIEPGATKEEIVECTVVSATDFTSCTRGLAFSGTSELASTTLQQTHNAGSTVVISNVHYVYNQLVDLNNAQSVGGVKTFTGNSIIIGDGTVNTHKSIFVDTGATPQGYVRYNASTSAWQFSNDGVNSINLASSTAGGLSAGTGININNSFINVNTAPTSTGGLGFIGNGLAVSTTFSNGLGFNADGLRINTSTPLFWSGSTTFGSTVSILGNVNIFGNVTTTNVTTTQLGATVVSSTNAFFGTASTTNIIVNGTNGNSLFTNSTTPSITTYFPMQCEVNSYQYASGDAVAANAKLSFAHTLGVRPSYIMFSAEAGMPVGNAFSQGYWTSSTNYVSQFAIPSNNAQATTDVQTYSGVIELLNSDNTVESSATLTTPTNTTQFSLTFPNNVNASPNDGRHFIATLCK